MSEKALIVTQNFAKVSLNYLQKCCDNEHIKESIREKIEFFDRDDIYKLLPFEYIKGNSHFFGKTITYYFEREKLYEFFISKHKAKLINLKEYKELIKVYTEEKIFREENKPLGIDIKQFIDSEIIKMIVKYVDTNDSFQYDESLFNKIYFNYLNDWLQNDIEIQLITPILGFNAEVDLITLSEKIPKVEIIKFTANLKNIIWDDNSLLRTINEHDFAQSDYCIVCTYKINKNAKPEDYTKYDKVIMDVITALRLTQTGQIGDLYTFRRFNSINVYEIKNNGGLFGLLKLPENSIFTSINRKYNFKAHEINNLCDIFKILVSENAILNDIMFGINRFNQSYSRKTDEDKIIDLTIALESTLLNDNSNKQELGHRFALRGAALLSEYRITKDTYEILKTLYNTRSTIVHNGKTLDKIAKGNGLLDTSSISYKDLFLKSENVTRDILKEYIKRGILNNNIKSINKEIDDSIIASISIANVF